MKINYETNNTHLKHLTIYSEIIGIIIYKTQILKNEKRRIKTLFTFLLEIYYYFFVIMILSVILFSPKTLNVLSEIFILIITFSLAYFFIIYDIQFKPHRKLKGELTINKNGIKDSFQNTTMRFTWEEISTVVIGKHGITILTNINQILYFDKSMKTQLIKEIKKHNKNIKIVKKQKYNKYIYKDILWPIFLLILTFLIQILKSL